MISLLHGTVRAVALGAVLAAVLVCAETKAGFAATGPDDDSLVISGTVVEAGVPVPGVRVAFSTTAGGCWRGGPDGLGATVTDGQGRFSFWALTAQVPDGAWVGIGSCTSGTFKPAGGATRYVSAVLGSGADPAAPPVYAQQVGRYSVDQLRQLQPVTVALQRPGAVVVTRATRGRELSLNDATGRQVDSAHGTSSGTVRFDGLVPGRYRVHVSAGTQRGDSPVLEVGAATDTAWRAATPAVTATFAGRVLVAGRVPGYPLAVSVTSGQRSGTYSARTGRDGRYRIRRITPGRYRVVYSSANLDTHGGGALAETLDVLIDQAGRTVVRNVDLARGSAVTATVHGLPLHGGWATADLYGADRTGRLVVWGGGASRTSTVRVRADGVAPGRHRMFIVADRRMRAVTVDVPRHAVVDLGTQQPDRPTLTVTGSVGVGGVEVHAQTTDGGIVGLDRSDRHGRFRLAGLVPGGYDVELTKTGRADRTVQVRVGRSGHRDLPVGPRTGPGWVTGTAVVPDGTAERLGVGVTVGGGLVNGSSGSGGAFRIQLPPGTYDRSQLAGAVRLGDSDGIAPLFYRPTSGGDFTVRPGATTRLGEVAFSLTD